MRLYSRIRRLSFSFQGSTTSPPGAVRQDVAAQRCCNGPALNGNEETDSPLSPVGWRELPNSSGLRQRRCLAARHGPMRIQCLAHCPNRERGPIVRNAPGLPAAPLFERKELRKRRRTNQHFPSNCGRNPFVLLAAKGAPSWSRQRPISVGGCVSRADRNSVACHRMN